MRVARAIVVAALGGAACAACGSSDPAADAPPAGDGPPAVDGPDAPPGSADARIDGPPGQPDAPIGACATALLYNDCDPVLDANCASIPGMMETQEQAILWSDDAAAALGLAIRYGGNHDQPAFRTLFDAGGFDVIVFESSSFDIEPATANRLASWVAGGGRLVFSFWDLDGSFDAAVATTLRTALDVTTPGSFNTPRSVHADPASPISLFTGVESFPSPLNFSNIGTDDGDELALAGPGAIAARLTSTTGPGAIAVTRTGRVVVFGFLPIELVYVIRRDVDADGKLEIRELYTNALATACGS